MNNTLGFVTALEQEQFPEQAHLIDMALYIGAKVENDKLVECPTCKGYALACVAISRRHYRMCLDMHMVEVDLSHEVPDSNCLFCGGKGFIGEDGMCECWTPAIGRPKSKNNRRTK
jgi:hypothetical protein